MDIVTEGIGYMAAVVGTFLMLPQLMRSLKTKSMDDVSMGMLWMYVLNCALWNAYGILLGLLPMILCNTIALCIAVLQVFLKLRYDKQKLSTKP